MVSCQETPGIHGGKLPDPSHMEPYQRGFSTGHQCQLIEGIKMGGSLGDRDHALEEFTVHRSRKEVKIGPLALRKKTSSSPMR